MAHTLPVDPSGIEDGLSDHDWRQGMIQVAIGERVAELMLSRQKKLNAMDRSFWDDLRSALNWIDGQDVGAIIFRGAGQRAFSVGGDIASFAALRNDDDRRAFQIEAMETFRAVANSRLPTIAAVNGMALGGGCELAMACDFVLAAKSATFGLPEARFGLVPGYGVLAAPRILGAHMARLLILTGETLTADEAQRCGLVQKIYDDELLRSEALRLAGTMAGFSPHSIAACKSMIGREISSKAAAESIDLVSKLHSTTESMAAVASFLAQHGSSGRTKHERK